MRVEVTDVTTGITKTYDLLRKAALSFSPEYVTSGSTIKVFSENGKLFKDQYKINVFTLN